MAHEGKIWLIGGSVLVDPDADEDDEAPREAPTIRRGISSVLLYDIQADSWGMGPAPPRAGTGGEGPPPRAAVLNGEIHVMSDESHWVYRGAAWVDAPVRPHPGPVVSPRNLLTKFEFPACESILLG